MTKSKNHRPQQPRYRWRYNQRCERCDEAITDWGYRISRGGNHFECYILCKKCGGESIDRTSTGWGLITGNGAGYAALSKREREKNPPFWTEGRGPNWMPVKNKHGVRVSRTTNRWGGRSIPYRPIEGKGWV
jgi:hypothetical protein